MKVEAVVRSPEFCFTNCASRQRSADHSASVRDAISWGRIALGYRAEMSMRRGDRVRATSIAWADACRLDDRAPGFDFRLQQRAERLGRRAFNNNAERREFGAHL